MILHSSVQKRDCLHEIMPGKLRLDVRYGQRKTLTWGFLVILCAILTL